MVTSTTLLHCREFEVGPWRCVVLSVSEGLVAVQIGQQKTLKSIQNSVEHMRTRLEHYLGKTELVLSNADNALCLRAEAQIKEYAAGQRLKFDLPLVFCGTEFQKLVWRALLKIPHGVTWSYGEQAKEIGMPAASRAVGAANGQNLIGIVVPCHRVIGQSGRLVGYAGGIEMKQWLLKHEGVLLSKT